MQDYDRDPREAEALARVNARLEQLVDVDRRVLSRRQTLAYMAFDSSRDFNIDKHKDLFLEGVLKIRLKLQSRYNVIAGIWDFADDFLVSGLIEKTRTRWGKFVPHIFAGGVPYALLAALFWLLPLCFSQEHVDDLDFLPKFFCFAALDLLLEFFGNVRSVAYSGYLSTITPYPSDRRRLLAVSGYAHNIIARLPDLGVEFTLDFIRNGIVRTRKRTTEQMIGSTLVGVGAATALVSGLCFAMYAFVAKERVQQKIERPRISDSLQIVFGNRPVLLYMFSNALGAFGTGFSTNDYYRHVLNWTTFETVAGIPSFFFQPFGYAKYNQLADRFSTKTLYIVGQVFAKSFYIPLFFYGMFLKDKNGLQFFRNRWAMLPVTVVWEIIYATFWGVRSISIDELRNECNDYIEWKCGYRNEATLSAASAFICKIPVRVNAILQPKFKEWIGYDQTAYEQGRSQTEHAQKWIFAMATLLPAILVISSMIPMFWFNIDKRTRDTMYRELNERRAAFAEKMKQAADGAETETDGG